MASVRLSGPVLLARIDREPAVFTDRAGHLFVLGCTPDAPAGRRCRRIGHFENQFPADGPGELRESVGDHIERARPADHAVAEVQVEVGRCRIEGIGRIAQDRQAVDRDAGGDRDVAGFGDDLVLPGRDGSDHRPDQ